MSAQAAADLVSHFGERVTHLVLCAPGIYSRILRRGPEMGRRDRAAP
ncbi:hypothetical protein ACFWFF_19195 [Streptomyces sp. NPDC060223]